MRVPCRPCWRWRCNHPHNWFRNAFVHIIDCPHGNWWFYVRYRSYVVYFEQTLRKLSRNIPQTTLRPPPNPANLSQTTG